MQSFVADLLACVVYWLYGMGLPPVRLDRAFRISPNSSRLKHSRLQRGFTVVEVLRTLPFLDGVQRMARFRF